LTDGSICDRWRGEPGTKIELQFLYSSDILLNMINTKQYDEMWNKFQKGLITQEVWTEFCNKVLAQILDRNADVLARLKNR
jgi:hypothetical protein